MKQTQVTLRNVDDGLKKMIDLNARKQNKSINQYVLDIVKERVGYGTPASQDWREFSGSFEPKAINATALEDFEKIDEEMWR